MGNFALDLAAFAKLAPDKARNVIRKVGIDALSSVVLKTPVGNPTLWKSKPPKGYVGGRLRANWNTAIGRIDYGITSNTDKSGSAAINRGRSTISRFSGDESIFITNNLPYAIPVEYGHSKTQAPQGMVRITVVEFQGIVDRAAKAEAAK